MYRKFPKRRNRNRNSDKAQIEALAKTVAKLAMAKLTMVGTIQDHTTAINILTVYYDNLKNLLIEAGILAETPVEDELQESEFDDLDIEFTTFDTLKGKKDVN